MDLLRLSTVGSVDDGKSTLIGRLLYDSKSIFEDQLRAVERASRAHGGPMNLALLTDGLRAERAQGITIDVAYRYFATPRRKFIIADTPGHFEFTRNMVTGASTADVAVVLVDVTHGVLEQSRRHALIASLLGVPNLVVCVNKMDLVDFSEAAFSRVRADFGAFAAGLRAGVTYIPISALHGDNVVARSSRLAWYDGPAVLDYLELAPASHGMPFDSLRFAVQLVIRDETDGDAAFRGYAGRVDGGVMRPGLPVTSALTGRSARIASIRSSGRVVESAASPTSVLVQLDPELDLERGDVLLAGSPPATADRLTATVCWMVDRPLAVGGRYTVKHLTRSVTATCARIRHRLDVNTHHRIEGVTTLGLNDLGVVELQLGEPLFVDPYRANRATGSFILIDDDTNDTVGAGMIEAAA